MPLRHISSLPGSFLAVFFVAIFSFLCLISSGVLDSEDGWLYASVARNIYYHHQIASAPNEFPELKNVNMNSVQGPDGVWRAPGSLGYSLSLVPAIFASDLVHRFYQVAPPERFPLEHDWSFHLFGSFTNAFYGAFLAVILLLYARELGFSQRYSVVIAVLTLVSTSLLPLTKFSFAHLMFNSFLLLAFLCLKKFGRTQKWWFLVGAALAFGMVVISYNVTYYLTIPALGVYLLMQETPKQRRWTVALGLVGVILALVFFRSLVFDLLGRLVAVPPRLLFEGVWGFLLSPGKSIFLYTPPLLLIPLFWHKIKPSMRAELVATAILTACYLYVVGSAHIHKNGMLQPIWHGGMSWGTRYISVLIPFWMLFVFHIIQSLRPIQKYLIVVPLFLVGLWVQLVGVSTFYLLQYVDLPYNFYIAKEEILIYDYASFIPRFTPLWTLSKQFVKRVITLPSTLDHGPFNVRFFDGWDIPYHPIGGTIRGFREQGYISFQNSQDQDVKLVRLQLYNAPDVLENGVSTPLVVSLNGKEVQRFSLPPQGERTVLLALQPEEVQSRNELVFTTEYLTKPKSPQVIYVKSMSVNEQLVNLDSIDYPDLSTLGSKTTPIPYRYSGGLVTDRWAFWQMRGRVTERTLDFWWLRSFYYWDRPVRFIWSLAGANVLLFAFSTALTVKLFSKLKA